MYLAMDSKRRSPPSYGTGILKIFHYMVWTSLVLDGFEKQKNSIGLGRNQMMKRIFYLAPRLLLLTILMLIFCDIALADDGVYRSMLKSGGFISAILGVIGISIAGYLAGKSFDSYTGWERYTHDMVRQCFLIGNHSEKISPLTV